MAGRGRVWAPRPVPYGRRTDPYGRTVVGSFLRSAGKRGGWPRVGEGRGGWWGSLGMKRGGPGVSKRGESFEQ